ncbi:4-amino-4-deoxy-L-arabinose transferase [Flavobacteriaceae bacterium MAR_2010_188]|nr:4-amino-4-deoxy-L-arabinose transferase [Flavobacteriaceae bacterium MAR_2010_188]
MFRRLNVYPVAFITIFVMLITLTSFDYIPVSIMESRNFITAREMVNDGNWLLPTLNGEPRYEKPPLPTWLSAVSGIALGIDSVFALRLPGIFMIMIIGIFCYLITDKLIKYKTQAFINSLIVITSFYVFAITVEAPWDIFAHGFMLMGIFFLINSFQSEKLNLISSLLSALCIGLSILSKGPVSVYALFLPFLIAYLVVFRGSFKRSKVFTLFSVIFLALIIGGWWFIYARINNPAAFDAVVNTESTNWANYNVRPFYYYWSFFIQSGIWTIPTFISLLYPYLKDKVYNLKAYQFTLLWTLISVILLSIIPEKKSRYLMPVLIPLALNTGFYIEYLFREFKNIKSYLELVPIYFYFGILAIACFVIPISVFFMKDYFVGFSILWYTLLSFTLLTIGLALFLGLKNKNPKTLFISVVGIMVSVLLFLPPIYDKMERNNYNPISEFHKNRLYKDISVYSINGVSPEFIWDYGDKIPELRTESSEILIPDENQFGLLVPRANDSVGEFLKSKNLKYKKISTYNLNRSAKGAKAYKDRLVNDLLLVSKE